MKNNVGSKKISCLLYIGLIMAILAFLGYLFKDSLLSNRGIVTVIKTITPGNNIKSTDGRTNVLLLGSDTRNKEHIQNTLTDTMIFASISQVDGSIVLISLPRDLWVSTSKGTQSKINAIYVYEGSEGVVKIVEEVLGMPVHYYGVVNFDIFKNTIDILGGIDVNVETAFTDVTYPVAGKEAAADNERYQTVKFEKGMQTMNGDSALKFVRSRHGNNGEGTDFARSKRQQKVIFAIKDKVLSSSTIFDLGKIKSLYDEYSKNVDTNVTLADVEAFYTLSQNAKFDKVRSFVLDDRSAEDQGGLLYAPENRDLYGGAYVLLPKALDYTQIHAYIKKYIFSDL